MEANQDRQRLAAVLETLARVLRGEAYFLDGCAYSTDYALKYAWESIRCTTGCVEYYFNPLSVQRSEEHASIAAKLAGVEVAKAVGDG